MIYLDLPQPTHSDPPTLREALAAVIEDHPEHIAASAMGDKAVARTQQAILVARAEDREPDFSRLPCERCGLTPVEHRVKLDGLDKYVAPGERRDGQSPDPDWERGGTVNKALCPDGERAKFTKAYFLLVVPHLDDPCPTITATGSQVGAASVVHPTEPRKMTPREVATVSGLPSDYILGSPTATREQMYERVGRGVPPQLYAAVGSYITQLAKEIMDRG